MAIEISSRRAALTTGDYLTGEEIESADWTQVHGRMNRIVKYYGAELCGHVWPDGSPHLTSDTVSLSDQNENTGRDLDQLHPQARFRRPDANLDHLIWVDCYGFEVELDVDIRRGVVDGAITTELSSNRLTLGAGSAEWATLKITMTDNEVREGGVSSGGYVPIELEFSARATASPGGEIYALFAYAGVIPDDDMP